MHIARRNKLATTAHRPHCIPVALPRLESDPPLARRRVRDPRKLLSRAWAASFACVKLLLLLYAHVSRYFATFAEEVNYFFFFFLLLARLLFVFCFSLTSLRPLDLHTCTFALPIYSSLARARVYLFYSRTLSVNAAPASHVSCTTEMMERSMTEQGEEIATTTIGSEKQKEIRRDESKQLFVFDTRLKFS